MFYRRFGHFQVNRYTYLSTPGPGCSKLTVSLVNVSLEFQMLISEICQYFLSKKCEKLQKLLSFFNKNITKMSVYLAIKS